MEKPARPSPQQRERYEALRQRVEALLLQSRRVPVRQVFSLADEMKAASLPSRRLLEGVASKLAALADAGELTEVLDAATSREPARFELAALVLQEMALRDRISPDAQWAPQLRDRLAASAHPLASLPLAAHRLEVPVELPHYRNGAMMFFNDPIECEPRDPAAVAAAADVSSRETFGVVDPEAVAAAVRNWCDESNGVVEIKTFTLSRPTDAAGLVASLDRLGLKCLEGAGGTKTAAAVVDAGMALRALFRAASQGGAYNNGLCAALGRLAAWRSLAAMAGAAPPGTSPDATVDSIAAEAEQCAWVAFTAESAWFNNIAWDLGLLALRKDRTTLVALAATDQD
jgi:hypothetical protein